jgi:hypothetical protein
MSPQETTQALLDLRRPLRAIEREAHHLHEVEEVSRQRT